MAESKRQTATGASRNRSNRRTDATQRLDHLNTLSEDLQQRLMTLEKRVTAMQAQLDHLKARQHS